MKYIPFILFFLIMGSNTIIVYLQELTEDLKEITIEIETTDINQII